MNWIWAFLTAILCLVTFVWGEARRSEREDERYRKLVGDDASQRTALRMLYAACGFEFPDLWETPEPQPSRWDLFVVYVKARFRGPAPVEPEPAPLYQPPADESWLDIAHAATQVAEPVPDTGPTTEPEMPAVPGPATQPDMKAAAAVAPLPALSYEEWKRQQDERFARDLAEIRGDTEKESA